jgi:hypothetical protein
MAQDLPQELNRASNLFQQHVLFVFFFSLTQQQMTNNCLTLSNHMFNYIFSFFGWTQEQTIK